MYRFPARLHGWLKVTSSLSQMQFAPNGFDAYVRDFVEQLDGSLGSIVHHLDGGGVLDLRIRPALHFHWIPRTPRGRYSEEA